MTPEQWSKRLGALRRSPSDTANVTSARLVVAYHRTYTGPFLGEELDYGSAGLKVDHARVALDEGIPNKQPERVREALLCLQEGTRELVEWCRANGYPI